MTLGDDEPTGGESVCFGVFEKDLYFVSSVATTTTATSISFNAFVNHIVVLGEEVGIFGCGDCTLAGGNDTFVVRMVFVSGHILFKKEQAEQSQLGNQKDDQTTCT